MLLWQLLHEPVDKAYTAAYFQKLGLPAPENDKPQWLRLNDFAQLKPGSRKLDKLFEQETIAYERPWSEQEFPQIAAWLKANDASLAKALEASQRP